MPQFIHSRKQRRRRRPPRRYLDRKEPSASKVGQSAVSCIHEERMGFAEGFYYILFVAVERYTKALSAGTRPEPCGQQTDLTAIPPSGGDGIGRESAVSSTKDVQMTDKGKKNTTEEAGGLYIYLSSEDCRTVGRATKIKSDRGRLSSTRWKQSRSIKSATSRCSSSLCVYHHQQNQSRAINAA